MNKRLISILAIALAAATASTVIAFLIGQHQSENDVRLLEKEIEQLHENEKQAAIVRRTSQQMEDIAFQQKALSDSQRDSAEVQRRLALQMRDRAEQESREAREAKAQALEALSEAEMQRSKAEELQLIAIDERDRATLAKSVSDTLYYRDLSHTLGITAITRRSINGEELSQLLAYASFYIAKRFKGNTYHEQIFEALTQNTRHTGIHRMPYHGAVEDIAPYPAKPGTFVAVSDYGEVVLCNEQGVELLFFDKTYDFRWVEVVSEQIIVNAFHGPVLQIKSNGEVKVREIPQGDYSKLIPYKRGVMLMAERHLVWFNPNQPNHHIIKLDRPLSSMVDCDGQLLLYFADGTSATIDNNFRVLPHPSPAHGRVVTAATYDPQLRCLCLGYKNGDVELFNPEGRYIERLQGHRSIVNDIQIMDGVLISCAYDKTAQLWYLPNLQMASGYSFLEELASPTPLAKRNVSGAVTEWCNPVRITFSSWAYSAGMHGGTAYVGTSSGEIHYFCYDLSKMAAELQSRLKRNLTPEEWQKNIGLDLPYETFK